MNTSPDRAESNPTARCAVVICTRNRPRDLRRTLRSIARQHVSEPFLVVVVDASDEPDTLAWEQLGKSPERISLQHLPYEGNPSLTRQRNAGLDYLPPSVELVVFLDDDVTLHTGCLCRLIATLDEHPEVGGVGGCDVSGTHEGTSHAWGQSVRRLFLLDHPRPGRLLASGAASIPGTARSLRRVEWLSGFCMAFRRSLLDKERFDERLNGYSLYEDRDLSYRIGCHAPLVMQPEARLVHHRSATNRHDAEQRSADALVHGYWLVEKNGRHPLGKLAFWWSVVGRFLAVTASREPQKWEALRGLRRGAWAVGRRDHPLLRRDSQDR